MFYRSTRGGAEAVSFSTAVTHGLAPDGGLYVPREFPQYDTEAIAGDRAFPDVAVDFLRPFLDGDALSAALADICRNAFDFPLTLRHLDERTSVLELFHGPTAAFKDFGARFLAECFSAGAGGEDGRPLTVLVATSGDTGAAVAAAFHRKPGIRVGLLFPRDGVSPRQARHLSCWDDNVSSFAVRGSFDDCQRLVKQAFADPGWQARARLTSANSINIGRLLPQAAYYAAASLRHLHERGEPAGFVVPAGNMGNALGAFWARHVGFPLREIALATNANTVVPEWFATSDWQPRAPLATLANAMDVGDPSNMERLFDLYSKDDAPTANARALSVDDETIRGVIGDGVRRWDSVWCPHTATAIHFREQLPDTPWIVVATAHPAKFDSVVEPLIGREVDVPDNLAKLLARPTRVTEIEPQLDELERHFG